MSNDFELSRRKALAALGSIGVASAGAGLGTSAYFSDQETFQNNRLVAGELDLKMDWEEHYSDWSADEDDSPEDGSLDIRMEEPDEADLENYTAYPPGVAEFDGVEGDPYVTGDPLLWIHNDDVAQFMANTSLEAFPDFDDDGLAEFPGIDDFDVPEGTSSDPCEYLADVGENDDGLSPDGFRTDNDDTRDSETGEPLPLINLNDVKPGDFGEVTFSAHICDNDGYLWLNGGLESASENGVTEPEGDDPDEQEGVVELLDTVQTALWYDNNCNNLVDAVAGEVDIMVAADVSGSIEADEQDRLIEAGNIFAETLPTDSSVRAGLLTFGGGDVTITDTLGPVDQFLDGSGNGELGDRLTDFGGNTPMPAALEAAQAELESSAARPDAEKIILLVTDGGPNYASGVTYPFTTTDGGDSVGPYPGGSTSPPGTVGQSEVDETIGVAETIESDTDIDILTAGILDEDEDESDLPSGGISVNGVSDADLNDVLRAIAGEVEDYFNTEFGPGLEDTAEDIAQRVSAGDQVFFQGTLREALDALEAGNGIPLDGDRDSDFDETSDADDSETREPFNASMTHCFGFSWWLPLDHGNEVQSDSVNFDIGFYTEQARHNDGAGMNDEPING
jgi:predicted ribosomally synthesized peptide with SipW-like signal peptide